MYAAAAAEKARSILFITERSTKVIRGDDGRAGGDSVETLRAQ